MSGPRHDELRRIFDLVLDAPEAERAAVLERACAGDQELRRRIEAMVAVAQGETRFMSAPTAVPAREAPTAMSREEAGSRIGPYKLLQLIGEGGFGSVFMAEQEQPVRRNVALKIIKLGMDTRQVVARFEQERQALAMMDHPNIAKVFDAGATETGRPYFVMELVRGVPITEYCDRNRLTARERLELFIPVCNAVQHAHQKGIIHRDLKPSNILVTMHDGHPVPKVIDFGIAKATNARLTEKTLFTEHRQFIGTPAYMSPEQAEMSGLDIDTRSDIYSLGVLLYELLTGTTPFDTTELLKAGYGEIQRIIREVDPPRPSTRVSAMGSTGQGIAAQRRTEVRKLGAIIRGDLDWIVMKAMEKDRRRRYESASGLAADVQRHLKGEAVEAAPPSVMYRVRKFVRRRRGLVAAVGLVSVALLGGAIGTSIGLVKARRAMFAERAALEKESVQRERAEAIAAFLRDMLASIDPEDAAGRDVTVKEVLDEAAANVETSLKDQPLVEAAIRHTLGETYNQLSRYQESKAQFERELAVRTAVSGRDDRLTLAAAYGLGASFVQLGDIPSALRVLGETLERQTAVLGKLDPDTLLTRSLYGFAVQLSGDEEQALTIAREVLRDQSESIGPNHKATLDTMSGIADVLQDLGRLDEAEQVARDLVGRATAAQGPDGPTTLVGESILASILNDLGRYAEAESVGRRVYEAKVRVYGPDHSSSIQTANVLALSLENLDRFDEAVDLLKQAAEASARSLGAAHSLTLTLIANRARNEQLRRNLDEAERLFREVLEVRRRVSGPTSVATLSVMNNLGLLLMAQQKPEEAEPVLREMLAGIDAVVPAGHWMRGQARVNCGRAILAQKRYADAEPLLLVGYDELAAALPEGHDRRTIAVDAIVELYRGWERPEEVERWTGRK